MWFRSLFLLLLAILFTGCAGPGRFVDDDVQWDENSEEVFVGPTGDGVLCGRCGVRFRGRNCRNCQVAHGANDGPGIEPPWPRFHPLPTKPVFEPQLPQYPNLIPRSIEVDDPPVAPISISR
jgi:hypothetical protein